MVMTLSAQRCRARSCRINPARAGHQRSNGMKNATIRLGIPVLAVLGAGCTTMGPGFGTTATGTSAMTFNWKSSDAISGSMPATATDGKSYSGEFFQVTSETTVDNLGPLWAGWGPGW